MTKIETTFKSSELKQDILREARSLGLQSGFATAIADQVAKNISVWLKSKPTVTRRDFTKKVATEIRKYHRDLAYLYENRDKII